MSLNIIRDLGEFDMMVGIDHGKDPVPQSFHACLQTSTSDSGFEEQLHLSEMEHVIKPPTERLSEMAGTGPPLEGGVEEVSDGDDVQLLALFPKTPRRYPHCFVISHYTRSLI